MNIRYFEYDLFHMVTMEQTSVTILISYLTRLDHDIKGFRDITVRVFRCKRGMR